MPARLCIALALAVCAALAVVLILVQIPLALLAPRARMLAVVRNAKVSS
jgi:hypothetical protein